MPLIVGAKDAKKYGATKDSAGNYSVGGKDPSSPTGKSGTKYGATGYVASAGATSSTSKSSSGSSTSSGNQAVSTPSGGSSYSVAGYSKTTPAEQYMSPTIGSDKNAIVPNYWQDVFSPTATQKGLSYAPYTTGDGTALGATARFGKGSTTSASALPNQSYAPLNQSYPANQTYFNPAINAQVAQNFGKTSGTWGSGGATGAKPGNKEQANAAGVPSTGGAAAKPTKLGDRKLTDSELKMAWKLIAALAPGKAGTTTTSDDVEAGMTKMDTALENEYKKALADLPDYNKMKEDYKELYESKRDLINDRQQQLEDRYAEDKAAIREDYEGKEQDLRGEQATQTGRLAGGLASAGAYLGFDNVNHSAMLSLEVTHQRELTVLSQQKMAAINEARRAFEDADFALLGEEINAIDKYNEQIFEITKTHFDQTLKLAQEARDNVRFMQETEKFNRDKSLDNLDILIEGGKQPTAAQIKEYAGALGMSTAEINDYVQSKIVTRDLEKKREKTKDELEIIDRLLQLDVGKSIMINGQRYWGLQRVPTSSTTSDRILSATDVMDKLNGSPYAYAMVGKMTFGQAVEAFSQEEPPDSWFDAWAEANGYSVEPPKGIVPGSSGSIGNTAGGLFTYKADDMESRREAIKDATVDMYQQAWANEKANVWGKQYSISVNELTDAKRDVIVDYLMRQEETIDGKPNPKKIYSANDLNDQKRFPYEKLVQYYEEAMAEKRETSAADLAESIRQALAANQEGQ